MEMSLAFEYDIVWIMDKNIMSHHSLHKIDFCELLDLWSYSMDTLCKAKDAVLQFKFTPDSVNVLGYYTEYVIVRGLENLDSNS